MFERSAGAPGPHESAHARPSRFPLLALGGMALLGAAACSGTSSSGPAPHDGGSGDTGDTGDTGASTDPWGCLDQPAAGGDPGATVAINFDVADAIQPLTTAGVDGGSDFTVISFSPVAGMTVDACNQLDVMCTSPLGAAVSSAAGTATLTVSQNFDGYFELTGSGYLPERLYTGLPLAGVATFQPPASVLSATALGALGAALQVTPESGPTAAAGHLFFEAFDCLDHHASGVQFALPATTMLPETVQWYAAGASALPSKAATETGLLGTGGVLNVPIGNVAVAATLIAKARVLANVNLVVDPGGVTFVWIRPRTSH